MSEKTEHSFGKQMHGNRFKAMREEIADSTAEHAHKFIKEGKMVSKKLLF